MSEPISSVHPDWSRESCKAGARSPSRALLASIRGYQRCKASRSPFARVGRMFFTLHHRWWSVVTGADIPVNCRIEGGLLMPHPNGIVIHPQATIGPNCLIFQQVTIGAGSKDGLPRIGGHVDIGAGAKILGGVSIGDHARIGANAVVTIDVPAGATAVGIPARVLAPRAAKD